jgi:hypothetical protein
MFRRFTHSMLIIVASSRQRVSSYLKTYQNLTGSHGRVWGLATTRFQGLNCPREARPTPSLQVGLASLPLTIDLLQGTGHEQKD